MSTCEENAKYYDARYYLFLLARARERRPEASVRRRMTSANERRGIMAFEATRRVLGYVDDARRLARTRNLRGTYHLCERTRNAVSAARSATIIRRTRACVLSLLRGDEATRHSHRTRINTRREENRGRSVLTCGMMKVPFAIDYEISHSRRKTTPMFEPRKRSRSCL